MPDAARPYAWETPEQLDPGAIYDACLLVRTRPQTNPGGTQPWDVVEVRPLARPDGSPLLGRLEDRYFLAVRVQVPGVRLAALLRRRRGDPACGKWGVALDPCCLDEAGQAVALDPARASPHLTAGPCDPAFLRCKRTGGCAFDEHDDHHQ